MKIWHFQDENTARNLEKISALPEKGFIWIDCQTEEISQALELTKKLTGKLPEHINFEHYFDEHQPAVFEDLQDYDFMVFRALYLDKEINVGKKINVSTYLFLHFEQVLVSAGKPIKTIQEIHQRFQDEKKNIPLSIRSLLLQLLHQLVDNFTQLREPLLNEHKKWQKVLLDDRKTKVPWDPLLHYKTNIQHLRVLCEEQAEVVEQWEQSMGTEINARLAARLNELLKHIGRRVNYINSLDSDLETLMTLHYTILNDRTNNIIRILTIIAGIFMPLTLVTGIFGMNFEHMAWLHSRYGYYYTLGGMLILALVLLGLCRLRRWL